MNDEYADNCLKGLPNSSLIYGRSVSYMAFPPSGAARNGWRESSINWEDDNGAVVQLFKQSKDGEKHFKGGIIRIPRVGLDFVIEHFNAHDEFKYERKVEDYNQYHGNLLFIDSMPKDKMRTICGALSGKVTAIIQQEGQEGY